MNETSEAEARESGKELTMECPAWEKPGSMHCLSELINNKKTELFPHVLASFCLRKDFFANCYSKE